MKQKFKLTISALAAIILSFAPLQASAVTASATVYISPGSSSVTKGDNVTVQVRVNSGTDPMNSAQATINYDNTKLQYVSYASGAFTTPVQSSSASGSFTYAAALLGSTVSSDKMIFSITFKTIASGTASLSLSGVDIANAGSSFSSISKSGGSIAISNPVTSVPTNNTNNTVTPIPIVSVPEEDSDTDAPKLKAQPAVTFDQNTITIKFDTDEKAKIKITYTVGKDAKSVSRSTPQTKHEFTLGSDEKLTAGTTYKIEIIATDEANNKATIYSKSIRTEGVAYTVQIVDTDGRPLANHPVELHSDPITGTTDENGYVTFADVTPGEHTINFDIDGLAMSQAVLVAQAVITTDDQSGPDAEAEMPIVRLPVQFSVVDDNPSGFQVNYLLLAVGAGAAGAAIAFLLQSGVLMRGFNWAKINIPPKISGIFKRNK
jgi:hypothetical protein